MEVTDHDRSGREHILVVDDEPVVRRFASRVLEEAGYRIATAADGAQALRALRHETEPFDAVVSDIVMPNVNGVELLQEVSTAYPELPVILMSGYATTELSKRGIPTPCGVLSKPFAPEHLLAEVRRCLDRKSPESSTRSAV